MTKAAAVLVAVFVVVCTAGLGVRVAGARAASVSRSMVVVSSTADVVNGSVSSLSALKARPGRDGISLREALLAANRTRGSATVYIMFSSRLNGRTIRVRTELPPIRRDHLVLEGVAPGGAPARVALDGSRARRGRLGELLLVQASRVTVRWLRFTGVDARRNLTVEVAAVVVGQGRSGADAPPLITNVQIVDNVFDNRDVKLPNVGPTRPLADGLMLGTDGAGGVNTHIRAVTIARNTFRNYNNDALGVLEASTRDTGTDVVIVDNTFEGNAIPIELAVGGTASRLTGTRIIGNTITGGYPAASGLTVGGIFLDSDARNGTIDRTLIEDNVISRGGILLQAAAYVPELPKPAGNVISNTRIVNNLIGPDVGGISITGGDRTSSPPSRVSAVTIENDTVVSDRPGTLFFALPNGPGASGNTITDVTVRNSIFSTPSGPPIYVSSAPLVNQPPDVVTNSLISGPDWAGTNGNINGDPAFLGGFRLAAGSPAINAGSIIGAPRYDLDGAPRDAQPDIGAFEHGAAPRPRLTVTAEQLGGSGTITSSPSGITCDTGCSARFDPGTTVTLTARPDRRSRFLGWRKGCSGRARCTITLTSTTSVTARFGPSR